MADDYLATYLNDHLAGSVAGLELLEHMEAEYAGTAIEPCLAELQAEVAADRDELVAFMDRLGVVESKPRKAAAWLAEKVTEIKLRLDDPDGGPLRLFEALEA